MQKDWKTNMNRPKSSSVPCRHVLVERIDRFRPWHLSVFLVHIMCARSRVVSDPNAKVLNLLRAFLVDLCISKCYSPFSTLLPELRAEYMRQHTTLRFMISPFDFLTFRNFIKKYQNLDLATTALGAKICIRYSFGVGLLSVGRWRPITSYSMRRPGRKVR